MDLHNVLIAGWYLIQPLFLLMYIAKGHYKITEASTILNGMVFIGLTASIFATGDPSSWQAVTLMLWWALNLLYSFSAIGKKIRYDTNGPVTNAFAFIFTCLFLVPFFLLGINIPSGV